jgi:hypothetical protein
VQKLKNPSRIRRRISSGGRVFYARTAKECRSSSFEFKVTKAQEGFADAAKLRDKARGGDKGLWKTWNSSKCRKKVHRSSGGSNNSRQIGWEEIWTIGFHTREHPEEEQGRRMDLSH